MDEFTLLIIIIGLVFFASGGFLLYRLYSENTQRSLDTLMAQHSEALADVAEMRERIRQDPTGKELDRLKQIVRAKQKKKVKPTLEEKFFQAGIFSEGEKSKHVRLKTILPPIFFAIAALGTYNLGAELFLVAVVIAVLGGLQLPTTLLDRKINRRAEDIMFFLPLVIEQISIGVSSSLDIGPCLQRVVSMADERDSHNAVTELLGHAEFYMRQGIPMEEALTEIGKLSGNLELKHAFMSLAQVARHGGEITKQLQELADSVTTQREVKIDGKIKKLELEATGPVALVFAGFLTILLVSFFLQVVRAF